MTKHTRRNKLAALLTVVLLFAAVPNAPGARAASPVMPLRVIRYFDNDWRFLKGDAPGAERPEFDDSAWRKVDVPHDWSIEGPFDEKNPTGRGGGFLPSGVGWYRKRFTLSAGRAPYGLEDRRVFAEFDGVMANSEVWVNGFHLGRRPYGYARFAYELTGHVSFGDDRPNAIAVRADTSAQPASRWYSGAGLYRHVRLVTTNPVHVEHWGTFVTTPRVTKEGATVRVESAVVNQSESAREVSLQVAL